MSAPLQKRDRLVLARMLRILRSEKDCVSLPLDVAARLEGIDPRLFDDIDESELFEEVTGTFPRDSFGLILPYVAVDEIEAFDARIRHLHTDVMALVGVDDPTDLVGRLGELTTQYGLEAVTFAVNWTSFYAQWRAWEKDHYGEWGRTGDEPRQEFDSFGIRYNEWLRKFNEKYPGKTTAEKQPTPSSGDTGGPGGAITKIVDLAILGVAVYAGFQILQMVRGK